MASQPGWKVWHRRALCDPCSLLGQSLGWRVCVWVPVWLLSGSLFLLHLSPSSSSLTLPWGYKEMTPKAGKALGRGVLKPPSHVPTQHQNWEKLERIKNPPLTLSVPQPACSLGSLLLSLSLQLLSSPIFWHQGFSGPVALRSSGLWIQAPPPSNPMTWNNQSSLFPTL